MEAQTKMTMPIETEPIAMRVALHPFLAGMNREQLALLSNCATSVHFEKGQIVFREGEKANRFYLIETGKVVLESSEGVGNSVMIPTIGPGDLLGWSWMFPPYTWQFTARAVEPTAAIFLYGTILREYCEKDYSLGYELLKRMSVVMVKTFAGCSQKRGRFPRARRTLLNPSRFFGDVGWRFALDFQTEPVQL